MKRDDHRYAHPWQGYVVDWKHGKQGWLALVVFMDEALEGSPLVRRWMSVEKLRPVVTDPKPQRDAWF